MLHDVLIAGAGPAGSYAAYLLARQGLRVAVIERANLPRDKVCGGGLSRKTLALLEPDIAAVVHARISGAWITDSDRASYVKDLGDLAACTVVRREFDHHLVRQAAANGAVIIERTAVEAVAATSDGVKVETSRGTLSARYLLGADGVSSTVRKLAFGRERPRTVAAMEALVHVSRDVLASFEGRALFDLGAVPHGYGWIFPKRDHLNVGVYSPFGASHLRKRLRTFMAAHPSLARHERIEYSGYPIPVRPTRQRPERGPVWLLGDAAGLAEPMYGEGIYFAIKSACIAAAVFAEHRGAPPRGAYAQRLAREVLPELRHAKWLARCYYTLGRRGFGLVASSARASDYFAGLITGERSYRATFYKALLTAPVWLLSARNRIQSGVEL